MKTKPRPEDERIVAVQPIGFVKRVKKIKTRKEGQGFLK